MINIRGLDFQYPDSDFSLQVERLTIEAVAISGATLESLRKVVQHAWHPGACYWPVVQ